MTLQALADTIFRPEYANYLCSQANSGPSTPRVASESAQETEEKLSDACGASNEVPHATHFHASTPDMSCTTPFSSSTGYQDTNTPSTDICEYPWNASGTSLHLPTVAPRDLYGSFDDLFKLYPSFDVHGEDEQSSVDRLPIKPSLVGCEEWEPRVEGGIISDSSIQEWVVHNTSILQEYANRQVPLPLNRRLDISLNQQSQFVTGALQLLVNRDHPSDGLVDPSRQLGPQLLENFVDVRHWASEYFRVRHKIQNVDNDVLVLLTAITNLFYEAHVQLSDRVVDFATEHMRFCAHPTLKVEHFAFGFDFRMSHDLPFFAEASSRIRDAVATCRSDARGDTTVSAAVTATAHEPVITKSGRQVRVSKKAQELMTQPQTAEKNKAGAVKGKKKNRKAAVAAPLPDTPIITTECSATDPEWTDLIFKAPSQCGESDTKNATSSLTEASSSGTVLCTPSAQVCHRPNHGNKLDLAAALAAGSRCPTSSQVVAHVLGCQEDAISVADYDPNLSVRSIPQLHRVRLQSVVSPLAKNEADSHGSNASAVPSAGPSELQLRQARMLSDLGGLPLAEAGSPTVPHPVIQFRNIHPNQPHPERLSEKSRLEMRENDLSRSDASGYTEMGQPDLSGGPDGKLHNHSLQVLLTALVPHARPSSLRDKQYEGPSRINLPGSHSQPLVISGAINTPLQVALPGLHSGVSDTPSGSQFLELPNTSNRPPSTGGGHSAPRGRRNRTGSGGQVRGRRGHTESATARAASLTSTMTGSQTDQGTSPTTNMTYPV